MINFNYSSLSGGYVTATEMKGILDELAEALEDAISRTSLVSNQMEVPLDMNSNHILNLPAPTEDNSPARLKDLKDFSFGDVGIITDLQIQSYLNANGYIDNSAIVDLDTAVYNAAVQYGDENFLTLADGLSTTDAALTYRTISSSYSKSQVDALIGGGAGSLAQIAPVKIMYAWPGHGAEQMILTSGMLMSHDVFFIGYSTINQYLNIKLGRTLQRCKEVTTHLGSLPDLGSWKNTPLLRVDGISGMYDGTTTVSAMATGYQTMVWQTYDYGANWFIKSITEYDGHPYGDLDFTVNVDNYLRRGRVRSGLNYGYTTTGTPTFPAQDWQGWSESDQGISMSNGEVIEHIVTTEHVLRSGADGGGYTPYLQFLVYYGGHVSALPPSTSVFSAIECSSDGTVYDNQTIVDTTSTILDGDNSIALVTVEFANPVDDLYPTYGFLRLTLNTNGEGYVMQDFSLANTQDTGSIDYQTVPPQWFRQDQTT